ncbi:septation protein SepH [Demequina sp.]|uniref:septation protein SepH n=1 Tax=Demequina sp. TaxID=2050685 RepID=UPI0025C2E4D8|nr:septation protein SepH [Demequina sp.]
MTGLSLKGLSEDGTHLIVVSTDGDEHRLAISDELRDLVRHARVMRRDEDAPATRLSPREIQQRIRAGLNATELAELTGEPVDAIAKFEPPVLAERAYIVQMARTTRIGRDTTAPTLGDLVGDRLAGRGLDPEAVAWDAWREIDEPWKVAADYRVDGRSVRALWSFDHVAKALTAEDDESTWLTETELLDAPVPRRHLSAVRAESGPIPLHPHRPASPTAAGPAAVDQEADRDTTDALLEDLASRRGTREPLEIEDDDDDAFEGFGPARGGASDRSTSMPHPAGSARPAAPAPAHLDSPASTPETPVEGADKRPRKGRASVPSWDEIVFGSKND